MSKLSQLQGKSKTFKIGGIDLELKPLSVDDLELFSASESSTMEQQMGMAKKLIAKVLKNSIPDATDEEIKNISVEHLQDMMKAITSLHNLSEGDSGTSKIKAFIKARQKGKTGTPSGDDVIKS